MSDESRGARRLPPALEVIDGGLSAGARGHSGARAPGRIVARIASGGAVRTLGPGGVEFWELEEAFRGARELGELPALAAMIHLGLHGVRGELTEEEASRHVARALAARGRLTISRARALDALGRPMRGEPLRATMPRWMEVWWEVLA